MAGTVPEDDIAPLIRNWPNKSYKVFQRKRLQGTWQTT